MKARVPYLAFTVALGALAASPTALAQDAASDAASDAAITDAGPPMPTRPTACPAGAAGCAFADIAYRRREGLPFEVDIDTGWVPGGSPVQVRFRAAIVGHTEIRAAGWLEGSWPRPITLRALGAPGTGVIESDYGVVLDARVRLHLDTDRGTFDWEGRVPYVPAVDFRARARQTFDPWAWEGVSIRGETARQHLADVPLTDAIIPIPGISGGLSFDARADLTTRYRSVRISFGTDADPITARNERTLAVFTAGPWVEYFPRLEGRVEQAATLRIYPSLYVSLFGRRWTTTIAEVPVPVGPFANDWLFDPARARLVLPDVARREVVVDFGSVRVGDRATDAAPFESLGEVELRVASPAMPDGPFSFPRADALIPPRARAALPVEFAPTEVGAFERRVPFQTSDPDTPTVWVTLRGMGIPGVTRDAGGDARDAGAGDAGDAGAGDARDASGDADRGAQTGGCGCETAGRANGGRGAGVVVIAGVAAVMAATRRRRARG